MFWYLLICILMLYPCCIQQAGRLAHKETNRLSLRIACSILLFFMALRDISVGTDTKYYCYVFEQFADIPLSKVFSAVTFATDSETWSFDFEPGYRLHNKIWSFFCSAPQTITVVNSILIIILLYKWLEAESPSYLLSIWLYITLGLYQTQMNTTRNSIAIFMVFISMKYAHQKRFWIYTGLILLSGCIHKTALIFLPLYWIINHRLRIRQAFGYILSAAVIGLNFNLFRSLIINVLPYRIGKYFENPNLKPEMLIVGLFYLFLVGLILIFMNQNERKQVTKLFPIGLWMFTLNLCCFGLNLGINAAARMAALFGPYIILFIPQLLSCIQCSRRRRQITGLVVLGCGAQYVLRMMINNIGGTMPYDFFFNV